MLPIIAVMFTFSFSSAFADISTDEVTALKTYATTLAQGYYGDNGVIAKFAQSYLDKITYDEDGYVFNMNEIKGYVKADTIKAYMADVVDEAEKTFSSKIASDVIDNIKTDGSITTNAQVQTAVEKAYDETMDAMIGSLIVGGDDNHLNGTVVQDLVAEQFKAEKVAADAVLAGINPEDYSDSLDEYKIVAADIDELATTTQLGLTDGKTYTAKGYVKAILDKQNADILAAETTVKTNAKAAVDAVRNAAKYAKESILGHKIVTGEDYYIEAVPTIADLKADTSVETAKANAIAQIKAALASKQVAMGQAIQEGIDALDKYGKLTDSQKELLDTLNEQKTDLAENFAAVEAVYVAKIGYKTTTDAVKSYLSAALDEIKAFANETDAAKKGMVTKATQGIFDDRVKMEKTVKTLKDDAALLALQKDVNGKPYYDAAVLAENLEDAIEAAYGGTSYDDCYKMLAGGSEAALINAKIEYIKFIKGDATNLVPKDSKGYKVTKVWNKAGAAGTKTAVAITKLAASVDDTKVTYKDADKVLYDKAQKAELKALVDETKAAIEGAKTIAEIEKIFAEANDKYNDIPTTKDHQDAWNTGKIGAAYDKADYEKELTAYATYFIAKMDSKVYDAATYADFSDVLIKVAYPVVYTAYTADELAGKVAEAKAAIDAIKTKEQVKAEKAAVEAAIKALPAASAITVADKDAITAAADLLDAFLDIPGTAKTDVTNNAVLDAALKAYEAADTKQIKDAYDALKNKDITTADAEAIEALRTLLDAHADFVKDYKVVDTLTATAYETKVVALEDKLSDAKVAEVKAMMIKLPTNPTAAQRAEVEAARAAYEALTLAEKAKIVGELPYQNLIDAEEALDVLNVYAVKGLKLTASSKATKGAITVKWTVKGDAAAADGFQVWKSTKMNKGYKKAFTTTKTTYKNTKGLEKGTKYYYKVRAYKVVDGKNVYSDWSNKAYRVAK